MDWPPGWPLASNETQSKGHKARTQSDENKGYKSNGKK